jgi:hypothetical protein
VDVKKTVDNINKKNKITTELEAKEVGDEINNDLDKLNKMIDEDYETYFLEVLNDKKIYEKTETGKKFHSDMVNLLSKIIREISDQFNNPQVVYYKKELEGFTSKQVIAVMEKLEKEYKERERLLKLGKRTDNWKWTLETCLKEIMK